MDRLRDLQAAVLQQFEAMSPRDRMLATGLVMVVGVVIVGAITWGLSKFIADEASRVVLAKERLAESQELAAEYTVLQARLASAESRMGQFKASQINTYIEGWATSTGLLAQLKEVRETGTQVVGTFRERDYRVELENAALPSVVRFLHAIETSPYPITVRSALFKVDEQRGGDRLMDLNLDLVTYDKEEG